MIKPVRCAIPTALLLFSSAVFCGSSTPKAFGPPGGWAISMAGDQGGAIYSAWHGGGVLRSMDGGRNWRSANNHLRELTVVSIAVDPSKPSVVYVGTEDGIFKSVNRGDDWTEHSNGLDHRDIWAIAVDYHHAGLVYAGTAGGGVYRSTNGGESWSCVTPGLKAVITALLIDPHEPATVYAATLKGDILRSVDEGKSWEPSQLGLAVNRVFALGADPTNGVVFAGTSAGVLASVDQGVHWDLRPNLTGAVFSILVGDAGVVYAGTTTGIAKSKDGGKHWTVASPGLEHEIVWSMLSQSGRIFAGTLGNGIFASDNRGMTWKPVKRDLPNQLVYSVVVNHSNGAVYAATAGAGVYESEDHGKSWAARNNGLANRVVKALVMDPINHEVLYAGAERAFLMPGGAVFKSSDAGRSWRKVTDDGPRVFSLAVALPDTRIVFAGTEDGKILRSVDSGTTWELLNSAGLTRGSATSTVQQAIHQQPIFSILLDPSNSNRVFAGTDSGIFSSVDGGRTWRPSNEGLTDVRVRSMAMDEKNPHILYAGTGDETKAGCVFRSDNGGRSWHLAGLRERWILSILVDPRSGYVIAGTDRGIFVSKDQGQTWSSTSHPGGVYILSLAVDSSPRAVVYGGTEGSSIVVQDLH